MMKEHPLAAALREKISMGLTRRSITKCSQWAEKFRVMGNPYPGPFRFKHHPWLREMHDSDAEMNIGQKGAQLGFTELAINKVCYEIDVNKTDCLYLLPNSKPDATDFSAARFNPALEESKHLRSLFTDVANVGHKRAGTANLYIRGSRSRSQLKSIPVGCIIIDEKDEMDADNVPLALERQSGQVRRVTWQISTPTHPEYGINGDYLDSSQNHFNFKCPCCERFTELVYPDCLVVTAEKITDPTLQDSYLICKECKGTLHHETKAEWLSTGAWVETFTQRSVKGWHVNQMYSPTIQPYKIAETVLKAERDPAAEQELWNSKLGLPKVISGTGVTDADIARCIAGHRIQRTRTSSTRILTMGVDVGKQFHFEIDEWILPDPGTPVVDLNSHSRPRILAMGCPYNFYEIEKLMEDFRINFCVIDAQPERRLALEFANKFFGRVRLCSYEQGIEGKSIHTDSTEPRVKVDRTSWLDLSLGRFKESGVPGIVLPADTMFEYKQHIKAQVRVYKEDRAGNMTGRYITPTGEDHFGHARNYAEIALPLAATHAFSVNIAQGVF